MNETFSIRLKQTLENKNITQRQLAALVNTSEVTICRYVAGQRKPGADMLYKLCVALDVSADYLIGTDEAVSNRQREYINSLEALIETAVSDNKKLADGYELVKQVS